MPLPPPPGAREAVEESAAAPDGGWRSGDAVRPLASAMFGKVPLARFSNVLAPLSRFCLEVPPARRRSMLRPSTLMENFLLLFSAVHLL